MDNQNFNSEQAFQQAIAAHQSGQFDKAEALLKRILEHEPNNDAIITALGGVHLSNGRNKEGIILFKKAIQLNPNNIDAHVNLGISSQRLGDFEKGYQLLSKAAKLAPERVDVQFNFANALLQKQEYPQAIEKLNQIIQLNPNVIQAYQSLGAVYTFLQKPDESLSIYEKGLNVSPNDLNILIPYGNLLAELGKEKKAEEIFQNAVNFHPNNFIPLAVIGKFYADIGKEKEGQSALEKAYSLNPNDLNTNILLGNINRTLGKIDDAEKFYRLALAIDPNAKKVVRSLRRILSTKIPYWHFEMLADIDRNDAYQKAIEKVVDSNSIILDIGTGSGLLSMMAARAGAQQITACEMHDRLAATAKEIVKRNGFENKITVFPKKSNLLKIGEEMPAKANLIISEILDCGVLGEGVLPSIRHAVQNLAAPNAKIIPSKVNLFCQLIEIPSRSLIAPIRKISGFDLSYFEQFRIPDEYFKINLKAEKYKALSPVIPLMGFDFYNLPKGFSEEQPNRIPLEIPISESGMAQAMVFWFDLFLDDEIMVSSKKDGELEHWGQALFCFPNPKKVESGSTLSVTALQSDYLIRFRM